MTIEYGYLNAGTLLVTSSTNVEHDKVTRGEFVNSWCSVVCAQYGRKVALLVL